MASDSLRPFRRLHPQPFGVEFFEASRFPKRVTYVGPPLRIELLFDMILTIKSNRLVAGLEMRVLELSFGTRWETWQ